MVQPLDQRLDIALGNSQNEVKNNSQKFEQKSNQNIGLRDFFPDQKKGKVFPRNLRVRELNKKQESIPQINLRSQSDLEKKTLMPKLTEEQILQQNMQTDAELLHQRTTIGKIIQVRSVVLTTIKLILVDVLRKKNNDRNIELANLYKNTLIGFQLQMKLLCKEFKHFEKVNRGSASLLDFAKPLVSQISMITNSAVSYITRINQIFQSLNNPIFQSLDNPNTEEQLKILAEQLTEIEKNLLDLQKRLEAINLEMGLGNGSGLSHDIHEGSFGI